jgi:integrase
MLTDAKIQALSTPATRSEIPDGKVAGLYLIVQPSGLKSWALRYRSGGKPVKLTLGRFPGVGLKQARQAAEKARGEVAGGNDPAADKRAARKAARATEEAESDRVSTVAAEFVERYARRNVSAKWAHETERMFDREILPRLGAKRLSEITRPDVHRMLDEISDRAPIVANRTLSVCAKFGSWAVERGYIDRNPFQGIKAPSPEVSRDRVLSDDEIRLAWGAFERVGLFGTLAKLLLLTGAREREIADGRWSEIDLEAKTWTIPASRSKNRVEHVIALSDAAIDILRGLPRVESREQWIFTVIGNAAMRGFDPPKKRVDRLMADAGWTGPHWVIHDLRRTVATNLQRLGVRLEVTEACLNHTSGSRRGIVGVYQRHNWADEKRQALDAWARRLATIVNGTTQSNVIELRA